MPSKKQKKEEGGVKNWYNIMPSSLIPTYHNPCFDQHKMKIPGRYLLVGSSGSGKTQLAMEILHRMRDTFALIVLCVKNADEPIYNYLRSKLKPEYVEVYEGGEVPPVEKYKDFDGQMLIIFDDLVNEKKAVQQKITNYFIYGRKGCLNNQGITSLYLTQTYFGIPKPIRLQANYVFLKKISSMRDILTVMRDHNLNMEKEELIHLYQHCTDNIKNFLMIDLEAPAHNRFRRNFDEIYDIPLV